MFEEGSILREEIKYNNILGWNKNYIAGFSFSYNLSIVGKNKKKIY